MHLDHYDAIAHRDKRTFSFFSKGPKGIVRKGIYFQQLEGMSFNLAFGNWNDNTQHIDDMGRIDNGDGRKILITVAVTLLTFLEKNPGSKVFFQGNTAGKRRLYQMAARYSLMQIGYLVEVEGFCNQVWEPFRPNKKYDALSVRARRKV